MPAPNYTTDDFARAMQKLLPRGRVWRRSLDSIQFALLRGFAPTYFRQTQRANNLLVDAFPLTTVELLPEWELSLGLPDPCAGVSPTIDQRRAQVVARFASGGGQSAAYFIEFAANLGYTIGVQNFAPFRVGIDTAGEPLNGVDWAYTWAVTAALNEVNYFRAGISAAGEPLAFWSNTVLECELNTVKPAHMILLFEYS